MPVERTGKLLCWRCLKPIRGGFLLDSVSNTACDKCKQIIMRENKEKEKERKRKAKEEARRERENARQAELAKKQRKRENEKHQKEVHARGGKVCPNCGHEMRAQLPELIYDDKTGESKFGPIPFTCMHCRDHYRIIFGKG